MSAPKAASHDRDDEQKRERRMNWIRGLGRRSLIAVFGCMAAAAIVAPAANANLEFEKVGVALTEADGSYSRQAGAHPDFTFDFKFPEDATTPHDGVVVPGPPEAPRTIDLDLPLGMVANPVPFLTCSPEKLFNGSRGYPSCPVASQVGTIDLRLTGGLAGLNGLYSLSHGPDIPARFGFNYLGNVAIITARVRPNDYGISAGSFSISQTLSLQSATLNFWGVPADPSHDTERQEFESPFISGDTIKTESPLTPFFINPTSCPEATVSFNTRVDSYEHPDVFSVKSLGADLLGAPFNFEGCENVPFEPSLVARPGTHRAHSPTGLDIDLRVPSNEGPKGFSAANVRRTVISFPRGMTVSPSAVAGLGACSEAQVGLGNKNPPNCPASSKLGNVTVKTQLVKEALDGEVVLASQNDNPFHSTYAVYLLINGPGVYLKLPGELNLDKQTGELKTVFENLPQLPFEQVSFDFRGGPTAPFVTPSTCGTYPIRTEVTSWASSVPVVSEQPIVIDEDCNGGGEFNPTLQAGVANPVAGAKSPLTIRIRRADGEQNLSRFDVTLPQGELASLKGVGVCPEAVAASGNCPKASQVGISTTAIGTGAFPLFVPQPGKDPTALYLAGPYKSAPYSLIAKVPAQSGPFDFGNIVVRTAIDLNPVTAQVIAKTDPLPQILEGVPISYRDVRIEVQKPDFTVNPTSCEQRYVKTDVYSTQGAVAHPSVPTKVGDCGALGFGPKLAFQVKGGTNRGDFQALTATLTTGKKEANIAKAAVTLPHSEFLEQSHIGTVCTRVQFAARKCPEASIYGMAEAVTPLLDQPLKGPVYLRSSNHSLPDLVAALNGQFDIELAGRIDSKNGGIRNTFEVVPDAPVTKFVLKMQGGQKSLLVNSRNLCKSVSRAEVRMVGQNGKRHSERPVVKNSCSKAKKKAKRTSRRQR